MALDNTVTLTGNVTREPELRWTPNGQSVANFGLAVNRSWMNRQTNEWEEEVSFFDVTCWAGLAENVAGSVGKGNRVTVVGRLNQQTWEKDGEKRSKIEVVADDVATSLKFATVEVTRTPRAEGGGGQAGQAPSYDPGQEPF